MPILVASFGAETPVQLRGCLGGAKILSLQCLQVLRSGFTAENLRCDYPIALAKTEH
jgi:hypothetical protein